MSDHFSMAELAQFRQLIQRRSGLVIDETRDEVLRFALAQRLKHAVHPSLADYLRHLEASDGREFQELIQLLTVGETFFFRTEQHWQALRQHVLPALLARRRREAAERDGPEATPSLRLWSVGCASGEEAYSLAILLLELVPDLASWRLTLLGTDINEQALATAIRGRYSRRSVETTLDASLRDRYFVPAEGGYQLASRVRSLVDFRALNLVHDRYPSLLNNTSDMDLILCRNVTIYFTPEQARDVQHRLYRALSPCGHLLIGHAETILDQTMDFELVERDGIVFHVRPAAASAVPPLEDVYPQDTLRAPVDRWARPQSESLRLDPPEVRGEQYLQHGLAYLQQGRADLARTELEAAVKNLPRDPRAHSALGEVYASLSRDEQAARQWQQAMEIDSLFPLPYFFMGLLHKSQGNYAQAEEHLRQAIYLDPQMVLARFHLAQLYHGEGQRQEASREYRNTLRYLQHLPAGQFVEHSEGLTIGLVQRLCDKAIAELSNGKP